MKRFINILIGIGFIALMSSCMTPYYLEEGVYHPVNHSGYYPNDGYYDDYGYFHPYHTYFSPRIYHQNNYGGYYRGGQDNYSGAYRYGQDNYSPRNYQRDRPSNYSQRGNVNRNANQGQNNYSKSSGGSRTTRSTNSQRNNSNVRRR